MGGIRRVIPVKPVCAVTYGQTVSVSKLMTQMETILGPVEDKSEAYPFSFTSYYTDEMGKDLMKQFLSFVRTIHPEKLPGIKQRTNELEEKWSTDGKRKVNLDPGYLTGSKLVLASTKDFAHRIFLGEGIYGDLQLQFRHNKFWPEAWTFPDYQTDLALGFFTRVRARFVLEENHDQKK
jgi:hypothetical protein